MSDDPVIAVEKISKVYRIWATPAQRLFGPMLDAVARWLPGSLGERLRLRAKAGFTDFFALDDVSFEVRRGSAVGIIGRNGAGKSTLLQIIAGTMQPTSGKARIHGRVAALLELGAGFNPDFTGRENVFLNGAILGLTRVEMEQRFPAIAEFADIGEFIEQPVKTYSSGMQVRLAFAVQTAVEPDILIVDEALGVGDIFFQQKCAARMSELRARGTTLLFVSHDMASVRDLCERTLYLRHGKSAFWGETQQAIAHYFSEGNSTPLHDEPAGAAPVAQAGARGAAEFQRIAEWWRHDSKTPPATPARLRGAALLDAQDQPARRFKIGDEARFQVLFTALTEGDYQVAVELKNRHDNIVTSNSSYSGGLPSLHLTSGESATFELAMTMNLEAGRYTWQIILAGNVFAPNRGQRLDTSPWLGPFDINWDYDQDRAPFLGMFGPPVRCKFISAKIGVRGTS